MITDDEKADTEDELANAVTAAIADAIPSKARKPPDVPDGFNALPDLPQAGLAVGAGLSHWLWPEGRWHLGLSAGAIRCRHAIRSKWWMQTPLQDREHDLFAAKHISGPRLDNVTPSRTA